jgi:hypothetical protein
MGNFSRKTFNPAKGYVGVRLQQGVPLVDADWNELDDVIRNEIYQSLNLAVSSGIQASSPLFTIASLLFRVPTDFEVFASLVNRLIKPPRTVLPQLENDFYVAPGRALVSGHPLNLPLENIRRDMIRYSTQPWSDPTRAAQDGVSVISPLTIPASNRTDLVYLDTWEREVNSTEDSNLINDKIGIETCVRLRREVAIRVVEGGESLPSAPEGHAFMPLALLNRLAGQAQITIDQIQDIRPYIGIGGTHQVVFSPLFLPLGTTPNWQYVPYFFAILTSLALKDEASPNVTGLLPLVLPNRVRLVSVTVHGYTISTVEVPASPPEITILLWRTPYNAKLQSETFTNFGESLIPETDGIFRISHTGTGTQVRPFNSTINIKTDNGTNIVDNSRYSYMLAAGTSGNNFVAFISGIVVTYQY